MSDSKMKICRRCKAEKPIDEFSRNAQAIDDRQRHCKPCCNEMARSYHRRNAEKVAAYQKKYGKRNRAKIKARSQKYVLQNLRNRIKKLEAAEART